MWGTIYTHAAIHDFKIMENFVWFSLDHNENE